MKNPTLVSSPIGSQSQTRAPSTPRRSAPSVFSSASSLGRVCIPYVTFSALFPALLAVLLQANMVLAETTVSSTNSRTTTTSKTTTSKTTTSKQHRDPVSLENCGILADDAPSRSITVPFTQERHINGMKKPLVSTGTFTLEAGKAIVWNTLQPIESKVVVSKEGIEMHNTADPSSEPELHDSSRFRELGSLLLSLHSLQDEDTKKLSKRLTLSCESLADGSFVLTALPNSYSLKRALKSVQMYGTKRPDRISVADPRGDITTITFDYSQASRTPQTTP